MSNAITMGIFWHLIGAASAACFYAPFKKVKKWSWETMWSVGGIVSWIILPWAISALLLPNFWAYYSSFSLSTLLPVFLFGAMWGIGNINYGLTMRYLGMSMGNWHRHWHYVDCRYADDANYQRQFRCAD